MATRNEPLSVTHPELATQADGWDPSVVAAFSHKVMPWKCLNGHSWDERLDQRARGRNCPYCANKRILIGYNDLATTDPELAAQAHGWDPTTLTRGSGMKREWLCDRGHVWICQVAQRKELDGCAVCYGRQIVIGVNDLATTDPELAAQARGWDPTTLTRGSAKKREWSCPNGHIYLSSVSQVVRGRGCGICAGRQITEGTNDLLSQFPLVAAEADGWDPSAIGKGSSTKQNWKCEFGHKWTSSVISRTRLGAGCPYCAGNVLSVGVNDLATEYPKLAAEADGWDPTTVSAGSHEKLNWKCHVGHQWIAEVHGRAGGGDGGGCPICSGKQVLAGFNDLQTTNPELAAQADGWDPSLLNAGSNKKVAWKCHAGHQWKSVVFSRALNEVGCPICSGKQVLAGFNDLRTTNPELAAQANGWDPTTLTKFSNKKVGWQCDLGHTWVAVLGNRTNGRNCPTCAGRVILAGFNDLQTTNPDLAAQADGWDPMQVGKGSNSPKRWWKCAEGHRWKTSPNSVANCPTCAQTGFDPNQSGWLYLIDNDSLDMFQIGISNFLDKRLNDHSRRGWEVIEVRGPMEGHLAQQLETAILHAVERRGAVLGHKAEIEKFDGYSEAWTKDSLTVTSFKQLLDWVYEDDQNILRT
jgi:hypothetical protein